MFRITLILLLVLIAIGVYDQKKILLLNDEQKQEILLKEQAYSDAYKEKENAKMKQDDLLAKEREERNNELAKTSWKEVSPEKYVEKFFADKMERWLLILLIPMTLSILFRQFKKAQMGY